MSTCNSSFSHSLNDKLKFYKDEISKIADTSFNIQQKQLCLDILDKATEENIDKIYQFIVQRVKTGFVFDLAPEVNNNCIALIEKDKKLSFESNALGEKLTHKLIIGENYDALKNLLAVYENKIDFIYIDPPYNTESTRIDGNSLTETEGQNTGKFIYRDKFSRTGWLNMMNERLQLARKLLSNKGVIFISIDDNEQAYLKVLCDDVFGEENFVCNCIRKTKSYDRTKGDANFQDLYDYVLIYCKNKNNVKFNKIISGQQEYPFKDERGKYRLTSLQQPGGQHATRDERPNLYYSIYYNENTKEFSLIKKDNYIEILPNKIGTKDGCWMWSKTKFENDNKDCLVKNRKIFIKRYFNESEDQNKYKHQEPLLLDYYNSQGTSILGELGLKDTFDFSKPVKLLKHLINIIENKSSIILDFFAGSGTTGQAVLELNEEDGGKRQFILCTNNENNIAENITYERLYRVINGEGTKREQIKWKYSKDKKSLKNNNLDVFRISYHELEIEDYEKGNQLVEQAKVVFKQLDKNFELKGEFDIYNKLASLKPYSEADREECGRVFSYQNKKTNNNNNRNNNEDVSKDILNNEFDDEEIDNNDEDKEVVKE